MRAEGRFFPADHRRRIRGDRQERAGTERRRSVLTALASPESTGPSPAGGLRTYKAISASLRDKTYPDVLLLIDEARFEVELKQWIGRRKKGQATITRFPVDPTAEVLVDGPLLRFSGLSVKLESPSKAAEIAEVLRRPGREREATRLLSEAEKALLECVKTREEAMTFLSKMKVDPREALIAAESLWPVGDTKEPLEAVYSSYSGRLAVSLEKMTSWLADYEKKLGPGVVDRLYALAYTMGAVQDALFEGDSDMVEELSALRELGVVTTAQELRTGTSLEQLVQRAHPVLVRFATARPS